MFVVFYGSAAVHGDLGQSIAELPWLPVGVTYAAMPIGSAITLLFVIERLLFGSQAARAVVRYEDSPAEAAEGVL